MVKHSWLAGESRLHRMLCEHHVPSSHGDWSIAAWSGELSDLQVFNFDPSELHQNTVSSCLSSEEPATLPGPLSR